MKRLYYNNCKKRNLFDALNSKIYKFTGSSLFFEKKNQIFSQCMFSFYTKNIFKKFRISSKSFKYLASYGKLPGVIRYTW